MKLKPLNLVPPQKIKPEIDGFYLTKYWRDIRKMHLASNPLCVLCERDGITTLASVVDHIIPRRQGGNDYSDNLQSLCYSHHQMKSATEGKDEMYNRNPKWMK